jgi:hypothetical protein
MYFPIDYYRFRNYRNIGAVFVSDNIVSISFSRKRCENESDLAFYRSFPIVFIPNDEEEEMDEDDNGCSSCVEGDECSSY